MRFLLHLLFRKNKEDATNNGMSPTIIVIISGALVFGMGFIGYMAGLSIAGRTAAYICMIALGALGGYISHVIANHSFVDYTPRPKRGCGPQDSYLSDDYFTGAKALQISHAQVTIVRESGGLRPPDVLEFFLNGKNAGRAEDGSSITVTTGSRNNVLIARDPLGALSPPFEFSVEKGRHSRVLYRDGRFVSAKDIGRISLSEPAQPF